MAYDPFARGPHPVGVRSGQVTDADRGGRVLPFEVWYPAESRYAGLDVVSWTQDRFVVMADHPATRQAAYRNADPDSGLHPLVVFSHTSGGHRRQSTFLCTHLASHGYVVAAVDHVGSTAVDFAERAHRVARGEVATDAEVQERIDRLIADRVPDIRRLLDELLGGGPTQPLPHIDSDRVGLIGWSFGGWAVLSVVEVEDRVGAVVAIAPAGSSNPEPGILPVTLGFEWPRDVAVLFLTGDRDRFTPLPGIEELYHRARSAKRMFVLREAGHGHFGDEIDEHDVCPRRHAHFFTRGLTVAHFDAALEEDVAAEEFLRSDATAVLQNRGIGAYEPWAPGPTTPVR